MRPEAPSIGTVYHVCRVPGAPMIRTSRSLTAPVCPSLKRASFQRSQAAGLFDHARIGANLLCDGNEFGHRQPEFPASNTPGELAKTLGRHGERAWLRLTEGRPAPHPGDRFNMRAGQRVSVHTKYLELLMIELARSGVWQPGKSRFVIYVPIGLFPSPVQ